MEAEVKEEGTSKVAHSAHENGNGNGNRTIQTPSVLPAVLTANGDRASPGPRKNINTSSTNGSSNPIVNLSDSLDLASDPATGGQIETIAATSTFWSSVSSNGSISAADQNADIARQAAEAKAAAGARATRSAAGTPDKAVGDSKWSKIKGYSTLQVGEGGMSMKGHALGVRDAERGIAWRACPKHACVTCPCGVHGHLRYAWATICYTYLHGEFICNSHASSVSVFQRFIPSFILPVAEVH